MQLSGKLWQVLGPPADSPCWLVKRGTCVSSFESEPPMFGSSGLWKIRWQGDFGAIYKSTEVPVVNKPPLLWWGLPTLWAKINVNHNKKFTIFYFYLYSICNITLTLTTISGKSKRTCAVWLLKQFTSWRMLLSGTLQRLTEFTEDHDVQEY